MGVFANLEPRSVLRFFEEIAAIPHGSGNTKKISDYLVTFAKERGLSYRQDEWGNVLICKEAAEGREKEEPIMLQGHMDMVAVKKPDSTIDMKTEGLQLMTEGDWLFAKDTSLGGDDGIAVAYELALLDAKDLSHPPLECIFTVDEEIGLLGAKAIDLSDCKAKRMINLDSEDEGVFWVGCAGGMRVDVSLPWKRQETRGTVCRITIGGLQGGHSGVEIHKERGNSNVLAGRFLLAAGKERELHLLNIEGGLADNAIPRQTRIELVTTDFQGLEKETKEFEEQIKEELGIKDPEVFCRFECLEEGIFLAVTGEDSFRAAVLTGCLPSGVIANSAEVDGLVETSLNMGLLKADQDELRLGFSLRSSYESAKERVKDQILGLAKALGGSGEGSGNYPGWAYRKESPLRETMIRVYENMYGKKPRIEAIHAGLECGFFVGKIPGLDCISIGPNMKNIHTTEERMSLSSVQRTWEFLCQVLEEV